MTRTAKPTALLQAEQGIAKPHRRTGSPTPLSVPEATSDTNPPADMSKRSKALWKRYAAVLQPMGLLTSADTGVFRMFIETLERYERAIKLEQEQGSIAVGKNGQPYQHPAVGMANQAMKSAERLAKQFGLTPSARASLEIAGHEAPEKKQEFILDKKINA
jgi:P27 family predicted phage terminase small subunit